MKLNSNAEFNKQYQFQKSTKEGSRFKDLSEKLDLLKSFEEDISKTNNRKRKIKIWISIGVVLSILLAWIIFKQFNEEELTKEQRLLVENIDNYVVHELSRSNNSNISLTKDQEIGYGLFVLEEFSKAIPTLLELWEMEKDTLALYYLGLSYLAEGEIEKSNQILKMEELATYNTDGLISE